MSRKLAPRSLFFMLTIGLLALVPIAASAQTQQDVDAAKRAKAIAEGRKTQAYKDYQRITADLEAAVTDYERLAAEHDDLSYRISRMETTVERYTTEAADLSQSARSLVIDAYTSGQSSMIGTAFTAASIQELVTSQALLDRAAELQLSSLDNLDAVSRQAERSAADLETARAEVAVNEEAAGAVVEQIALLQQQQEEILNRADANLRAAIDKLNQEIREKALEDQRIKRQQAEKSASRPGAAGGADPSVTPGFICPVQGGASFIDSWGFPRSGGRKHKGVDMFAPRNRPLVAVVDGKVKLSSNSLGGLTVHLYSDNGTVYYYAHLESQNTNLQSGQRVSKGTIVGYVGNSGNARYTSTHLHFEIRPGGKAVNPYPTVRASC